MADYNSNYTGQEIDEAVGKALTPDSAPTAGSQALVTSGGVAAGLAQRASASDVNAMAEKIPSGASSSNKLVTQADIANFITRSVNDLVNYYLKSDTYTKQEVQALIAAINQFHYEVYESLSDVTSPASNVLYLIGPTGSGSDKYEEYVWPNATLGFVKIGDTSIDLSGYVTTQALNAALATKVNISDIVDNLTTDDATKVLSAKQGKALDGKVNQLGQDVSEIYSLKETIKKYVFNGTNGTITFNRISLLNEGDYVEIDCLNNANTETLRSFAFALDGDNIAFSLGTASFGVKAENTWLQNFNGAQGQYFTNKSSNVRHKYKWAKTSDGYAFYLDDELIDTVTTSLVFSISCFGGPFSSTNYFKGEFYSIKFNINGVEKNVYELPGYVVAGDVTVVTEQVASGKLVELQEEVTELQEEVTELSDLVDDTVDEVNDVVPYVELVKKLGWSYKLNGTDSEIVLNEPIVLSQDGDSLEIDLETNERDTGSYAFATSGRTSKGGIAVGQNVLWLSPDEGSDNIYFNTTLPSVAHQVIKVEYVSGDIKVYRNGTLLWTYTGQKTMSIYGFGHGWNGSYGYWEGVINSIKVNGAELNLNTSATLTNTDLYRQSGFLTDSQAAQLNPPIIVRKVSSTSFALDILNRGNGKYLTHTFSHNIGSRTIDNVEYNCMDIWNADDIMDDGVSIFQGNFNMVYKVGAVNGVSSSDASVNEDCNIGSTHGCEVIQFIKFFADGVEIDPVSLTEPLICSVFRIVQKSTCYVGDSSYDTGNSNNYPKVVDGNMVVNGIHFADAVYRVDNRIKITNRFIQKRNSVQYSMMCAAMAQAHITDCSVDVILNDADNTWNIVTNSGGVISYNIPAGYVSESLYAKTSKADSVIMDIKGKYILHQSITNMDNSMRTHSRIYSTNNNSSSIKCYLQPLIPYGQTNADTFNEDDEICALNERSVEFGTELS